MDLEAMASELLAEHDTPGGGVGLVAAGEHTIATAGTRGGDRGPVEHDTIFAAASLTWPVFAAGVMTLVDNGTLELDRPLSEYLSEPYLAEDDRAASITARMVLSSTTGLPNWREGSNDRVHPARCACDGSRGRAGGTPARGSPTSRKWSSDSALPRLPTFWPTLCFARSA